MKAKKILKEILPYAIILVVVVILRHFIITPIEVSGDSMQPNIKPGEVLLLDKISYRLSNIKRFDIVVIDTSTNDKDIIKRVIGLPGEHIAYRENKLFVNDEEVNDNYSEDYTISFSLEHLGYNIIPEDKYLVLGDNRDRSSDSRNIGLIDRKQIEGKAVFRIWPLNKFGGIK